MRKSRFIPAATMRTKKLPGSRADFRNRTAKIAPKFIYDPLTAIVRKGHGFQVFAKVPSPRSWSLAQWLRTLTLKTVNAHRPWSLIQTTSQPLGSHDEIKLALTVDPF